METFVLKICLLTSLTFFIFSCSIKEPEPAVSRKDSVEIDGAFISTLSIENTHGDINITGSDKNLLIISYKMLGWSDFDLDRSEIEVLTDKTGTLISINNKNQINDVRIDYNITIPAGIKINIKNKSGNVGIKECLSIESILVDKGHVKLNEIGNIKEIKVKTGNISIENFVTLLLAETENGKVTIK